MPVVPRPPKPSVTPPLPGGVGDSAAEVFARAAKDRAETTVALDATNRLQGLKFDLSNPDTGYRSLLGGDAVKGIEGQALTGHYLSLFDQGWKDISSKLMPGPKGMFDAAALNMRDDFAKDLVKHEAEQGRVWRQQVLDTTVGNATGALIAGTGGNDAGYAAKARAALVASGAGQGLSGEDLDKQTNPAFGRRVVEPVVTARLNQGDVAGAKAFFDVHRDGMAGDDADILDERLTEAKRFADTRIAVDGVWNRLGPKSFNDPIDLDAIEDGLVVYHGGDEEARTRARDELLHRIFGFTQARDETHAGYVNFLIDQVKGGASPSQIATLPQFLALPKDKQRQLSDWHREQLADKLTGLTPDQNLDRMVRQFAAYHDLSSDDALSTMSTSQVQATVPIVGDDLNSQLVAQKQASDAGRSPRFDDTTFRAIAAALGIDHNPGPFDVEGKARLGVLRSKAEAAIASAEADGKVLTPGEHRQIAMSEGAALIRDHQFFGVPKDVQDVLETKPEDAFGVDLPVHTPSDVKLAQKKGDRVQEVTVTTEVPIANSGMDGRPNTTRSDFGPKPRAWVVTPSGRRISLVPETGTGNDTKLYLTLKDDDTGEAVKRVIQTPAAGQRLDIDFGALGHVVMVSSQRQGMLSQAVTSFANAALDAFSKQGVGDRDLIRTFAHDPGKVIGGMAMAVPRRIGAGWSTIVTDSGRQRFVSGITTSLNKTASDIGNAYRDHYLTSYIFDKAGRLVPSTIDTVTTGGEGLLAKGGAEAAGGKLIEKEATKYTEDAFVKQAGKNTFVDLAKAADLAPGFYRADPKHLRFGQHVASPNFSNGGTISDLVAELAAGKSPDMVGNPLRVIIKDGKVFTLDNRRLLAFNGARLGDIAIQVVDKNDPEIMQLLKNPTRMNPIGGEGKSIVVAPRTEHETVRELLRLKNLIK